MDNLLTIEQITKKEILSLIDLAYSLEGNSVSNLSGKVMTSFFMEPSTRTRLSFEAAFSRMGGSILTVAGTETSAMAKNESLSDSLRVISSYSDLLVARINVPIQNVNVENLRCPIINAGDAEHEHPTQTLLDIFSLHKCFKKLEDLKICIAGDLLYGRTVHSLVKVAGLFDWELYLLPANNLGLPQKYYDYLINDNVKINKIKDIKEVLPELDVLYMTRLQSERGASNEASYVLDLETIKSHASPDFKIFHPLPRNQEIPVEIDNTSYSYYFEQAQNGVAMRQAIISMMLGD